MIDATSMHRYTDTTERVAQSLLAYARDRLRLNPVPLDGPRSRDELAAEAGRTITADGLGAPEALRIFAETLAPATVSVDNPRYLAFIPAAPTELATLFDLVVGASSVYGGSWLEGAGAVYAENEALRWIADLAGMPESAGGCFVSGGTIGNLSALVAARHAWRRANDAAVRPRIAATEQAHSSIDSAAQVMDVDVLRVPADQRGRLTGEALAGALAADGGAGVFAVATTAGTTNLGVVDDLAGVAAVCRQRGLWMHVDGAYGAAALAAPSVRGTFAGIEHADSLIVDPHKWLFAPFDCCALLYRDPALARAAHTQSAGYLDPIQTDREWNPSDYAIHLSRRARGLPFWFSLAAHGTAAYSRAIEATLELARAAAGEIERRPELQLLNEPDLSVLVFRRIGWAADDYHRWSSRLLSAGTAFVTPTTHEGEIVTRFAIVNPRTTLADIAAILDSMR
jgi:glutamate/tyrosine decarboxylase-like PLP-dependent enzyme